MIISHEHKFIFLKTKKTAGTSIELALSELCGLDDVITPLTTVDETRTAIADSRYIRTAALAHRITYYTTMAGCEAATEALKHSADFGVMSLQELHAQLH